MHLQERICISRLKKCTCKSAGYSRSRCLCDDLLYWKLTCFLDADMFYYLQQRRRPQVVVHKAEVLNDSRLGEAQRAYNSRRELVRTQVQFAHKTLRRGRQEACQQLCCRGSCYSIQQ